MSRDDEVRLVLTIDVTYDLGRTGVQELERLLLDAANHLADEGLLSGTTEAWVRTWGCSVTRPPPEKRKEQLMRQDGARIGDKVRVFWRSGDDHIEGTVKYMPQDVGDSWIIWADDGTIHHVQQYESLFVLGRKAGESGEADPG